MSACLQNYRTVFNLLIKSAVRQRLMKLFINKIIYYQLKLCEHFASVYVLRNRVWLCGDSVNCH